MRFFPEIFGAFKRLFIAPPPSPDLESVRHATQLLWEASERLDSSADGIGKLVRDMRRGPKRKRPVPTKNKAKAR